LSKFERKSKQSCWQLTLSHASAETRSSKQSIAEIEISFQFSFDGGSPTERSSVLNGVFDDVDNGRSPSHGCNIRRTEWKCKKAWRAPRCFAPHRHVFADTYQLTANNVVKGRRAWKVEGIQVDLRSVGPSKD
jgi:hypothetical protein